MSEKLTQEQQSLILNEWNSRPDNPPGIKELTEKAFPDVPQELQDGRSKYGRAVKAFLATRQIKAHGAHEHQTRVINLTEEDEQFIENNVAMMNGLEIARVVFANNTLTNLHQEVRVVNEYIKSLGNVSTFSDPEEIPSDNYKIPKTFAATLSKIIKYVPNSLNKEKLTPKNKKDTKSLMGYLATYRFSHQVNTLHTETDRELFESSFVRYTYNKGDLTQEEVDQYIILSTEVIIASNIQARIEHLQNLLEDSSFYFI